MKKQVALGIAASVLGFAGVASAGMAVHTFSTASRQEAAVSIDKTLAADCWAASGTTAAAGCTTGVAGLGLPGLPSLPEVPGVDLDSLTGILGDLDLPVGGAEDIIGTVQGVIDGVAPIGGAAAGIAADCALPVGLESLSLPVDLPINVFSAGMTLTDAVQSFAQTLNGIVPTLPVALPVNGNDVLEIVQAQVGCAAGGEAVNSSAAVNAAAGAISAANGAVSQAGTAANGAVNTAGSVATNATKTVGGVAGTATNTVNGIVGGALNTVNGATGSVAGVTGTAGSVAGTVNGTVGSVTGTVNGLAGTATGAVNNVVGTVGGLTGLVNGLLPTSTPSARCSGTSVSGGLTSLLGSLTAKISC